MSKKYKKDLKESRYKGSINNENPLLKLLLPQYPEKMALLALIKKDEKSIRNYIEQIIEKGNYTGALLVAIALKNNYLFEVLEKINNYIKSKNSNPFEEEFINYVTNLINKGEIKKVPRYKT
jgi:hypothetical protein